MYIIIDIVYLFEKIKSLLNFLTHPANPTKYSKKF